MPKANEAHALTSYYVKEYQKIHDTNPVVNRHSARWGFDSVLMDLSVPEAQDLIDFYLSTSDALNHHSLPWFFSNYDKLIKAREEIMQDRAHRERLRAETEQRVKEWREKNDKQRTTDN